MPNYNFKCPDCESVALVRKKISEISEHVEICKPCNKQMFQFIESFSSSVKMDEEQRSQKIKEDARKIAEKVKAGDQNLISQIYGEK